VQRSATHHLDIEVALPEHTDSGFARDGKRFDEHVVKFFTVGEALTEFGSLAGELIISESRYFDFKSVDLRDNTLECLQLFAFTGAEDTIENAHVEEMLSAGLVPPSGTNATVAGVPVAPHERAQAAVS